MSEMNFDCGYDDTNRDETEQLHQRISEIESENSCYRLLIQNLEDELVKTKKCELKNVSFEFFFLLPTRLFNNFVFC
jgi:disulfide oxidoreductase YuzD